MAIDRTPDNWTVEIDVAVAGSGGCGLTAGIAAAQNGMESHRVIAGSPGWKDLPNTATAKPTGS